MVSELLQSLNGHPERELEIWQVPDTKDKACRLLGSVYLS